MNLQVREKDDVYYFTGCVYNWASSSRQGARAEERAANVVRILNAAGIEPVVSNQEVCCGHDLLWSGDETTSPN